MQYKGVEIYQVPEEIENLRKLVRETEQVPGVIAEIGTYQGASALIIREETEKEIYTFDTFTGFPDSLDESDCKAYYVGDCMASDSVARNLLKDKNVNIIVGVFPETGDVIKDKKFSFVHIDVDIYKSTKDALEFFKDKMSPGGVILIHDYPVHTGVKKAVDEITKVEIIGTFGRQAIVRL